MADDDSTDMLREMAEHRGYKLVKSRRRTPGVGDFGHYGLRDSAGKEAFGFGRDGLTASAEEVEEWLRSGLVSTWKRSARQADRPRKRKPPDKHPAESPPRPRLEVRDGRPADSAAIAALLDALGFPTSSKDVRSRLAKLDNPPLVAAEGEVVGVLTWHVTPVLHRPKPVGRITMMVVEQAARGRGIGGALVSEAEARLAAAGCGLVEVTSNIELAGAHDFYRSRGYDRTSWRFAKPLG
jgi:GNAT superfamily N-acetyltransferase